MIAPSKSQVRLILRVAAKFASVVVISAVAVGCNPYRVKPPKPVARYQSLPPKNVPDFLKGTVMERVDLVDSAPLVVSGYGLVVNLQNTGDNVQIPTPVRDYMIKEMVKRGFGSKLQPGFETMGPEEVLRDPRTAIVRVDAVLETGARRGDSVDVRVSAIPTSNTSSLAHGELYRTELKLGGANPMAPAVAVTNIAIAQGPVFVNPSYLLADQPDPSAQRSLRTGWILDGGKLLEARPLALRLRQPERRFARAIEQRIDMHYASLKQSQRDKVAVAEDEGIVRVSIPPMFRGDSEHFAGVTAHLFFNASPQFVSMKAKQLAELAVTPDAPLLDISFCWEGLGAGALPFIVPLMTGESPEVTFAAARAAAFLGDLSAPHVLAQMASDKGHPFQVNAVRALGELTPSPSVAGMIRSVLDSDETLARIEAYKTLSNQRDSSIYSRVINERFVLDVVPSAGTPLIYATRSGIPRIALIGPRASVEQPFNFSAFNNRLTLVDDGDNKGVRIYYRNDNGSAPIRAVSRPDLAELVARLGGDRAAASALSFSYTEIVAVLQAMADQQQLAGGPAGKRAPATFVLQSAPALQESILEAPPIQERPVGPSPSDTAASPTTAPAEPGAVTARPN